MKYCLLLLIAVKSLCVYGIGFHSNMPFQMEFEIPAFPQMGAMPFPPIFNPAEAMQRETMEGDTRGMDIDEAMGNITTKNKTELKDGFKVTTITRDGPGFHSYIKEYENEGNSTGNGTAGGMDMAKMMGGSSIFNIMKQLRNAGRQQKTREQKCNKCAQGKFCDPIFHLCRKKFSEGRTCMFQKQCGKRLRCQWGKCQKAKAGDPGTFCKGNSQCTGESCCRNTPGSFHLMCIPRQSEGAICGLKKESFANVLYIVKRSVSPSCAPCESGLKCAETGDSKYKRCVKTAYVEKAADELEDDNPSNALDDDDDKGKDDDKVPPGGEANPLKGVPPKAPPPTSKNPIDDSEDNNNEDEDDKNDSDDDKKDDNKGDDDKKKDEDKKIKQGTGEGIPITPSPKKKAKGKNGKSKTKDKST